MLVPPFLRLSKDTKSSIQMGARVMTAIYTITLTLVSLLVSLGDFLGRLKRGARNMLRARGEIVTDIEITTIESGEVAMALWVIPGAKTGVMGVP